MRLKGRWKFLGTKRGLYMVQKKDVYLRCAYDTMRPYDEPEHEHHVLQA